MPGGELRRRAGGRYCYPPRLCEKHAELTEVDFSRLKYEGGSLDAVEFDFDGLTDVHLPLIGSYQPRNAALAITALR